MPNMVQKKLQQSFVTPIQVLLGSSDLNKILEEAGASGSFQWRLVPFNVVALGHQDCQDHQRSDKNPSLPK